MIAMQSTETIYDLLILMFTSYHPPPHRPMVHTDLVLLDHGVVQCGVALLVLQVHLRATLEQQLHHL